MPEPSRQFDDGQCATPVPVRANSAISSASQLDAMGVPYAVAHPSQRLGVFTGSAPEGFERPGDVLGVLGQMGVQPDILVLGQRRRVAHQLAGDRERRARSDADPDHRALGRIVERVDHPDAIVDDVGLALDQAVGRQAAVAFADAHRAASRVEPQAHRRGRLDGVLEPDAVGVEIEVVGARPAARQGELRQTELRRDEHVLGPHPRPDRVERFQPPEKESVLARRHRAGQRLVQVVMGVDERGRRHAAAGVDDLPPGGVGGSAGADARDPAVLDEDIRARRLAPVGVHRDDRVGVADPEFPGRQRIAPFRIGETEVSRKTGVISGERLARPGRFELPTS